MACLWLYKENLICEHVWHRFVLFRPGDMGVDEVGLAAELSGLQDDVIVAEGPAEVDLDKAVSKVPALRSEPMGRLYIEQGSKSVVAFTVACSHISLEVFVITFFTDEHN